MLDFYHFVESSPTFRKFQIDELLFTAYDCPLEESPLDYWVGKNYFCYIVRGGARWKTPTEEFVFEVGDAAFLRKGAHRVFKLPDRDFCALLIFIPDEFIAAELCHEPAVHSSKASYHLNDTIFPLNLNQNLEDYFHTVLNYFSQSSPPAESLLRIKFQELIINLVTSDLNPTLRDYFREICQKKKPALKPIMEEHFIFNLKMEDFARLSGRSLATFKRDFQQAFGCPPGKWLKNKRITYAKFLLETTDLNVNEIASESGFENTSHFIKTFKENYGHPPLKFKKLRLIEQTA